VNGWERGRGHEPARHGLAFRTGLGIALAASVVGVRAFADAVPDAGRRLAFVGWIVGAVIAHDALLVPFALSIGALVHRFLPPASRPPVRFGLAASGTVLLLAWRPLTGSGASRRNDTIQPLDYSSATLGALLLVWALAGAAGAWRWWRARRDAV
jgi:hypothetical protein